ncbi:MAG: hypothetical protein IPO31_09075 [Candidatus Obscuribacter sp.]|jgi:hypothetical protein|nr:hypothetical protein [Candidatus Obscuribacter sp.]
MNCENCDLEIGDTDAASGQSAKWNWNFCPECGVNLAPLKKLVKPKPGQSEESKAKAKKPTIREMVLDVVVRQALVTPNWLNLCKDPMEVNGITVSDVKKELFNRGYRTDGDGLPVKLADKADLRGIEDSNVVAFNARLHQNGGNGGGTDHDAGSIGPAQIDALNKRLEALATEPNLTDEQRLELKEAMGQLEMLAINLANLLKK